jgi:hypothetical protein
MTQCHIMTYSHTHMTLCHIINNYTLSNVNTNNN